MVSTVLAALGVAVAVGIYSIVSGLRRNIALAKSTGFKYFVLPCSPINLLWQLTFTLWVPLIKLLPKSWWEDRLFVMLPDWAYSTGQEYWNRLGVETFITVSPGSIFLFSQHAELIHKMTQSREAFPKDVALYGILSMFGHNVLTTEGAMWRMHRKATSASFNEKNAAYTFAEAIKQTHGMLASWFGPDAAGKETTGTIRSLEHDSMTWALNIIAYVGFGLRLVWPGQKLPADVNPRIAKYGSLEPPAGHTMTFHDSVAMTLEKIVAILLVPSLLLKYAPFKSVRLASQAKENFVQYMSELLEEKSEQAKSGAEEKEGMDLMGQLVDTARDEKAAAATGHRLTDSAIVGNAFIMLVAGHETTANTIHFALVELATNPGAQRRVQRDVDSMLGRNSDSATWEYEKVIGPLLSSHVGACLNEVLRMMPPVVGLPKVVSFHSNQTIVVDGVSHVLPAGMSCSLSVASAHRNPRWWPTRPSERTGAPTDLDDFLPERWYRTRHVSSDDDSDAIDDRTDYGGFRGSDTAPSLYRPVRGSYVPFSDGPRSCLGRRIAMVEMAAVLGVIFQEYSIELAVDEWASDDEVAKMTPAEKRAVYAKAQRKSRDTLRSATSVLTLKLHGDKHVAVRFVKRGHERFVGDVELS